MGVPEQVRELRRSAGLTQKQLATRAGVGLRFICELEQGRRNPSLGKVEQVLALFGHHLEVVNDHAKTT